MKVFTQEPSAFKPIAIVLETREEAIMMINLTYDIKYNDDYSDETRLFAKSLYDTLEENVK